MGFCCEVFQTTLFTPFTNYVLLIYDGGGGEKKVTPKLEVKKSQAESAISSIPDDILAQALSGRLGNGSD
jgi:hypothetical protein